MIHRAIKFLIENKLVTFILLVLCATWGLYHSPYQPDFLLLPNDPVSVDAIPDIGENQQIVYTSWEGQSPEDIENQITYPLTSNLLGITGVKTVRSSSMFGFSSIYVIFEEEIDFYWARSRILERLNSLPNRMLPPGIVPQLGPDATALGQIFWYTIEGRDTEGNPAGGWDLHEIRSIQDFYVKNALSSTRGISEVASIGGYVQEYQIDLVPELMRQYGISLQEVIQAVQSSNKDVGAKTLEINRVEYFIRGLGYLRSIEDIEQIELKTKDFAPIHIKEVARVSLGPAERRGILDKGGAEVVGGVAVAQYGSNPMQVIKNLKTKIGELSRGLPSKVLPDGRTSKLTIVPFYDRTVLIQETMDTLGRTLGFEILITMLVVIVMLMRFRVSLLISSLLPIVVLMVFIAMRWFEIDANIVALSGIAIAVGTIVDMGIILTENIVKKLQDHPERNIYEATFEGTKEVSGAILTAGLTTIVSFIPVFSLTGAEGKLFTPLAFTKTAALSSAMMVTLFILPPLTASVLSYSGMKKKIGMVFNGSLCLLGILALFYQVWLGLGLIGFGALGLLYHGGVLKKEQNRTLNLVWSGLYIVLVLAVYWKPLGRVSGLFENILLILFLASLVLGTFYYFSKYYTRILNWSLENKGKFLMIPFVLMIFGVLIMFKTQREFMPSLDEGSYLLMPTSMPHAGISENKRVLKQLDMAVANLPEVSIVVGKAGRAETALDPAPLSMYENMILYKPEYIGDENHNPIKYKVNSEGFFATKQGSWVSAASGINQDDLIPDKAGTYYRNWRPHINNRDDIWQEIVSATSIPGVTSAPKLQPIETRLVMLQTGMRANMGIKVKGQELKQLESFGIQLESILKEIKGLKPESVYADRIVGKPYLEIDINRSMAARYGLEIDRIQEVIEVAIGGKVLSRTVQGRESYGIRVRYPRELRTTPEEIANIHVDLPDGGTIPLNELVSINYLRGPQVIRSEDGFIVSYVIFDKDESITEVTAVQRVVSELQERIKSGELTIPSGISYEFGGNYQNQTRAAKRLGVLIPLVLVVIFLILYLQFRSVSTSLIVFSGVAVSFSGGFLLIWLYGQTWFMDFSIAGGNVREWLNIREVSLSVAVWVGFIALFGIATDDGVVMATYLKQSFKKLIPQSIGEIRTSVIEAGKRRIRPCLMTTATTILALLPVLTSTGRGSDIMIPMAIPCMGGMLMALLTLLVVPVLFSWRKENLFKKKS